jgi:thiol:disulfide interchange protein DsbC
MINVARSKNMIRQNSPVHRLWTVGAALFGAALLTSTFLNADDGVDEAVEKAIRERLTVPAMRLQVDSVQPSVMDGVYEVQLSDGPLVYTSETGEFFIVGDLYSVGSSGLVNLGEQRRSGERRDAIEAVPASNQIVFPAEGETLAHITVFTDVSCGFCQKLHREVPELNRRGVEVRYLAFPRQGLGSPGFRQLATAWCAADPQGTLTRLKNLEALDDDVCDDNPIAAQYQLGKDLGVTGTPAIIMPDGVMIPGYRPADELVADLGLD